MNLIRQPLALIALLFCCLAGAADTQPAAPKRLQPDRWLLIVDTSSAMKSRVDATQGMLAELIASGMNGQMKPGAEFRIWTYNKELYAGVAPKQIWNPAASTLMVNRTLGFLEKQGFHNKAQIQPMVEGMSNAVSVSQRLTIVWVSDGSQKISGTPFDEEINNAFATNKPALAKSRMPLLTVLRVYHGKYIGQSVTVAPWPVPFPAFPIEPEITNAVAKAAAGKPVEPVKSIFMSGPNKSVAAEVAPGERMASSIRLRPPPDSVVPEVVTPPSKAMETVQPLPLAQVAPTAPVAAPVEPAPVIKPSSPAPEARAMEPAAAGQPAVVPPAGAPAPVTTPAPQISSPAPAASQPPVVLATETVTARKWPLILGIGFMWVAIVAALLLARRARKANAGSLITRSLNR